MSGSTEEELKSAADIDGAFAPLPRSDVTAVVLDGEAVVLAEGASGAHYLDELATLYGTRSTADPRSTSWPRTSQMCSAPISPSCETISSIHRTSGAPGCSKGWRTNRHPSPRSRGRLADVESPSRPSGCRTRMERSRSPI